jgi:large subunit ribosomal protein L10
VPEAFGLEAGAPGGGLMSTIKVAKGDVIDEVRTKLDEADAAVVTEYRGLTVAEMASLRKTLRAVGGDYKVFKNTLVLRAISGSSHEPIGELLVGPTAIAFVSGDVSAVAKALRDFAKAAPALVIKGGVLEGSLLGVKELAALADLPSRDVLLAMFAGALAAPLRSMAGLLKAVPQSFAYGLSALIESKGGAPVAAPEPEAPVEEAKAEATTVDEAPADADAVVADPEAEAEAPASVEDAVSDEAPADEAPTEESPAEESAEEAPAAEPADEPAAE